MTASFLMTLLNGKKHETNIGGSWQNIRKSTITKKQMWVKFHNLTTSADKILSSSCEILVIDLKINRTWGYPENFGIYSQLDRKSKTWFFTFLNVYVSWIEQDKILNSQLSPPKFWYFADQNVPKRGPHPWKWILTIFKCKNEFAKRLGLEKQMKKNGVICLVFMSPSWVRVVKLSKIVSFLQFLLMSAKN